MKRKTILCLAAVLAALMLLSLNSCGGQEIENEGDDMKENETTEQRETPKVFLESLSLDDGRYSIGEFKADVNTYKVALPGGRPAVPRVTATAADGVEVKINQAAIPDTADSGKATVVITDAEGNKNTYTVEFTRDTKNGFVLQYDDRYRFVHTHTIKPDVKVTYESSDESVITVSETGLMTAKKLSDSPVTVKATIDGKVTDTMTVDRVEKAHINLFFITGQSNGQGCYDSVNYGKDVKNLIPFEEQLAAVEEIGGQGRVYSYDVFPRSQNTEVYKLKGRMYDMADVAKQGHQNSLGKVYYELSGEKVVFLQSAYSGSPIESWLNHRKYKDIAGTYGGHYFYAETLAAYNKLIKILEDNYEIVYVANFWCQGETAMSAVYSKRDGDYIFSSNPKFDKKDLITDETYYKYFMMLHEDMKADFGLQYNGIMFTRTKGGVGDTTIVPIVSAYFALCNENDDIHVATRRFIEIGTQYGKGDKDKEGYGFIGTDNNHYNQIGYNYHGREAAINAFNAIFGCATNCVESVEIIAKNGIDRLNSEKKIDMRSGTEYRLGALPLPYYSNDRVVWSSSDESVATVNEFGKITAVSKGNAIITVTATNGQKQSVYINVIS